MGKVTEWFVLYFSVFKLVRIAKLNFPSFRIQTVLTGTLTSKAKTI